MRPAVLLERKRRVGRIHAHGIDHAGGKIDFIPLCDLVAVEISEVHVHIIGVTGRRQINVTAAELAGITVVRSAQKRSFLLTEGVCEADARREVVPFQAADRPPRNRRLELRNDRIRAE